MAETASPSQRRQAQLVVVLMLLFIVLGVFWYGFSSEVYQRIWNNLSDRPGGPMTFRIFLQPVMASIAAVLDGLKDAKQGRSAYLWSILFDSTVRVERLKEGLMSTARIILLGLGIDVVYQIIALKTFYPGEAVIVAITLAFLPYLLLRGPISRIARRFVTSTAVD
jgi:hypothetical protein